MSSPFKLDRATLAKFLPTHEAVIAFESLFKQVVETTPETITEVEEVSQVSSRSLQSEFTRNDFLNRLEILEQNNNQRQLIAQLERRIKTLEEMIGV